MMSNSNSANREYKKEQLRGRMIRSGFCFRAPRRFSGPVGRLFAGDVGDPPVFPCDG